MSEGLETPGEFAQEVAQDSLLIADALGGWRGMIDSAAPTAVFLAVFVATHSALRPSVYAAVGVGLGLAVVRLASRRPLQQVASGLLGLAFSAYLATRTGHSRDFFVAGLIQNTVYGTLCVGSLIARRPVLGYVVSALRGQPQDWRLDAALMRTYRAATWLWAVVFGIRLAVTLPLYLAGEVATLAAAKLILGWPVYAGAVFATVRIVKTPDGA